MPYKAGGSTLVSVKMVSPFEDEYFFQHIPMHFPHRTPTDLYHDQHALLPKQIRFFVVAMLKMLELWGDDERLQLICKPMEINNIMLKHCNRIFQASMMYFVGGKGR